MLQKCEDCTEINRLEFQIAHADLSIDKVKQNQISKDTEHELIIQNLTNRMDNMSQELLEFKSEVKQDIQSIKDEIPDMFDNAVNKMLAKIAKWLIVGIISFIGFIILVIVLAFSRPYIIHGLQELTNKAQNMEVPK